MRKYSNTWWLLKLRKADARTQAAEQRANREAVDKLAIQNASNDAKQNEWRTAMKDREGKYMTRAELWIIAVAVAGILLAIYFK